MFEHCRAEDGLLENFRGKQLSCSHVLCSSFIPQSRISCVDCLDNNRMSDTQGGLQLKIFAKFFVFVFVNSVSETFQILKSLFPQRFNYSSGEHTEYSRQNLALKLKSVIITMAFFVRNAKNNN